MSLTARSDAGELRRAEEGEVTGLRQQGADRQGAVALGVAALLLSLGEADELLPALSLSLLPPQAVRASDAVASTTAVRQGAVWANH